MTYDRYASSNQMKLYVNGTLMANGTLTDPIKITDSKLIFGDLFYGYIDEIAISDRTLTQEEIGKHFANPGVFEFNQTFYRDADGDSCGNPAISIQALSAPAGYVIDNTDCDDNNPLIHPGAVEVCDGVDNNCNGQKDEGFPDTDHDVIADCVDFDDDNDGVLDVYDCAPLDSTKWQLLTGYVDADFDGYGGIGSSIQICSGAVLPSGYAAINGDCNDNNALINPGATEICGNGIDDDCDGSIDEGCTLSLILRPNANGSPTECEKSGTGGWNWDRVDEVTADDGATYVRGTASGSWQTDTYNVPDQSLTGAITNVRIYIRSHQTSTKNVYARTAIRIGTGSIEYGTQILLTGSWTNYYTDYATKTGNLESGAWTWADINNLQIGVGLQSLNQGSWRYAECTQVWVEVTYKT